MNQKNPMTPGGYKALQEELKHLKSVERPEVVNAIAIAREHGDLSENAEYHAAREKQSFIEGRIADIEDKLSRAEVVELSKIACKEVCFGATVTVTDEDTEENLTFQIVGSDEADVDNGLLSVTSPLARALIGQKISNYIEVNTPSGGKCYSVKEIKYI